MWPLSFEVLLKNTLRTRREVPFDLIKHKSFLHTSGSKCRIQLCICNRVAAPLLQSRRCNYTSKPESTAYVISCSTLRLDVYNAGSAMMNAWQRPNPRRNLYHAYLPCLPPDMDLAQNGVILAKIAPIPRSKDNEFNLHRRLIAHNRNLVSRLGASRKKGENDGRAIKSDSSEINAARRFRRTETK